MKTIKAGVASMRRYDAVNRQYPEITQKLEELEKALNDILRTDDDEPEESLWLAKKIARAALGKSGPKAKVRRPPLNHAEGVNIEY